ncbi:putative auxin efflux carrier component 3-like [Capsicum annuum]|nr:putative auxin efflux carrier component 3-like [Capsicum annuum]
MNIEEKVHAKEEETRQLQTRTQEKKEAEIKQLWRNLNFKANPMPAFYHEPDHRSEKPRAHLIDIRYACYAAYFLRALCCFNFVGLGDKVYTGNSTEEQPIARKVVTSRASCTEKFSHRLYQSVNRKRKKQRSNSYGEISISKQIPCLPFTELASKTKSQSRPSTAAGARATSATENTICCLRAEVYNRCSTNEHLNMADSPQVLEVTIHPSTELSNNSVPSAATSKTSKQTQLNRTVAPKREQEKRQVANSPRLRTLYSIRSNKDFKDKEKTKVLARRTGNHATRKDVRSMDLSHSARVGCLPVGVAS